MRKTFRTKLEKAEGMDAAGIVVPFDPKDAWGKTRVPVVVNVAKVPSAPNAPPYSYRSTIAKMGGRFLMPFAREHREASGIGPADEIEVTLIEDAAERTVAVPPDLASALDAAGLRDAFGRLSYSHRKEHVRAIEEAKKPETRVRRVAKCVEMAGAR